LAESAVLGSISTAGAFTFLVRVDCEHGEAERWAGSAEAEERGFSAMLALLRNAGVPATLAFVGLTALTYPRWVRDGVVAGHAAAGHSHTHARAYAGQPLEWQAADMRAMADAIQAAVGVRPRGVAGPCHGAIDANTLRAAEMTGLEYVLTLEPPAHGSSPAGISLSAPEMGFAPAAGGPASVQVPPAGMRWIWDWTSLQPGWPAFTTLRASEDWQAAVDDAVAEAGLVGLIVHPWIVHTNAGELDAIAGILDYARQRGACFQTFDDVVSQPASTPTPRRTPTARKAGRSL